MNKYILALTLSITVNLIFGQVYGEFTFGGQGSDEGRSIQRTSDGGFIISGKVEILSSDEDQIYLLKLDSRGYLEWQRNIQNTRRSNHVLESIERGYLVAGYAGEPLNTFQYICKVEGNGIIQWEKRFSEGSIRSIYQLHDGNYIFTGTDETGQGEANVCKISARGDIIWEKLYGEFGYEHGISILETNDDSYILAAINHIGGIEVVLTKLDQNGNIIWEKRHGGVNGTNVSDLNQTLDGGYILGCLTENEGTTDLDFHLIKTNSEGDFEWEKYYGGESWEFAESVVATKDGGYAMFGTTLSYGLGISDFYLVKTNGSGDVEWEKTYGGNFSEDGYDLIELDEGGYALVGATRSFGSSTDVYFILTNQYGNVMATSTIDIGATQNIKVFPNPTNSGISFELSHDVVLPVRLKITSLNGVKIIDEEVISLQTKIEESRLPKGLLVYTFYNDEGIFESGKILVE